MNDCIRQAIALLEKSESLFVLTGAGVSAESGVPTFRASDGLWRNYSAQELATPQAFHGNPTLVWEWYHWRQGLILKAEPNPAHHALARLEDIFQDFLMLTQNVDDMHFRGGSRKVLELHGNIFRVRCCECGKKTEYDQDQKKSDDLPRCACGGLLRPDVVWFGEAIPEDVWREALNFLKDAGVAMICGTSSVVWPAAAIPEFAQQQGVKTIEVNPDPTPVSSIVDVSIRAKAGEVLPVFAQALGAMQKP
jgi:NAD-dependent deacetylase